MQRQDEAIQQDVIDELAAQGNLETSTIAVGVKNGVVHLDGIVPTNADRLTAERLSRRVPGVQRVVDDLRLSSGDGKRVRL